MNGGSQNPNDPTQNNLAPDEGQNVPVDTGQAAPGAEITPPQGQPPQSPPPPAMNVTPEEGETPPEDIFETPTETPETPPATPASPAALTQPEQPEAPLSPEPQMTPPPPPEQLAPPGPPQEAVYGPPSPDQAAPETPPSEQPSEPLVPADYRPSPYGPPPSGGGMFGKILVFFLILVIGGGAAFYFLFYNKASLSLAVEPTDATISIDNTNYTGKISQPIQLKVGEHTLKVTKDGYADHQEKFTLKPMERKTIKVVLEEIAKAIKLIDEEFKFLTPSADGKDLLALGNGGKTFYKISTQATTTQETPSSQVQGEQTTTDQTTTSETSNKTAISPDHFVGIKEVIWHKSKELAILKVDNSADGIASSVFGKARLTPNITSTWLYDFKRYDLLNQTATLWSEYIGDIVFSADGEKVAYYNSTPAGEKSLVIADKNNQNQERVLDLKNQPIDNPKIAWSADGQYISLIPQSTDYNKNVLWLYNVNSKKLEQITQTGDKKSGLFSPDSKGLILTKFSKAIDSTYLVSLLYVALGSPTEGTDLEIETGLDQFVWTADSSAIIFASLGAETESDQIQKITVADKTKTEYSYTADEVLKPKNLLLSTDGTTIYFLSNGRPFSLKLVEKSQ